METSEGRADMLAANQLHVRLCERGVVLGLCMTLNPYNIEQFLEYALDLVFNVSLAEGHHFNQTQIRAERP